VAWLGGWPGLDAGLAVERRSALAVPRCADLAWQAVRVPFALMLDGPDLRTLLFAPPSGTWLTITPPTSND
jgi:hypothetical protein